MGLFKLLKRGKKKEAQDNSFEIHHKMENDLKREDYPTKIHAGTPFEKTVVTFEERKKTAIPSNNGLYPGEILLLHYCSKGTYPNPKLGYPGFWWYEYGIRNVDELLWELEQKGFIRFDSVKNSVRGLTVEQLKKILSVNDQIVKGKKEELIERVKNTLSEEAILNAGVEQKYTLTKHGEQELEENAYVPYMHNNHFKTIEDSKFGMEFNLWSINRILGTKDKTNWKMIVDEKERKLNEYYEKQNERNLANLKELDPKGYSELSKQEKQIKECQNAQKQYLSDKNIERYIDFWEELWEKGGLKFEGARWHFELPDLYIKSKRYDEALAFCKRLKTEKSIYASKADNYIEKIEQLKEKESLKKNR